MKRLFITGEIPTDMPVGDLTEKIMAGLMTPDMRTASIAGCHFDIEMKNDGDNVKFTMRTREKISILKYPDGRPVSVLIKRK